MKAVTKYNENFRFRCLNFPAKLVEKRLQHILFWLCQRNLSYSWGLPRVKLPLHSLLLVVQIVFPRVQDAAVVMNRHFPLF